MPTTPRSRRSTLLRSALTLSAVAALTALTALTACGAGGSGGSSNASSNASGASTPSATGTPGVSSSTVAPNGSTATATATATGNGGAPATPAGVLWQPWKNASYKVGFFEPPADGGGSVHPMIVTFGRYIPEGETWTVAKTNEGSRYEMLATGKFYLSCLLTGKKAPAPGSDFCPVTLEQLDSYVIAHPTNLPEFWYTLDGKGRINLAYQLYRQ